MEEEKEVCYFSGKNGECSVLHSECTGTRSRQLCSQSGASLSMLEVNLNDA